MKRKFVVVIAFFAALMFSAPSVMAEDVKIQVNRENGELRLAELSEKWTPTDVSVSKEALKYGDAWKEAFKNPGISVPVVTHAEYATKWLTTTITTFIDKAVVYNEAAKCITVVANAGVKQKNVFNPLLILVTIAVLAMAASNILMAHKKGGVVAFALVAVFAAYSVLIVVDTIAILAVAAFVAFAAAAFATGAAAYAYAAVNNNKGYIKAYKIASIVFYCVTVAMVVAICA